jgi:hypothetical protein
MSSRSTSGCRACRAQKPDSRADQRSRNIRKGSVTLVPRTIALSPKHAP